MADTKISALPSAVSVAGTEVIPVAKSGTTQGITPNQIRTFMAVSGTNTGDQDLSGLVPKTTTVNGYALSSNVVIAKADVGLSNVDNTSDANKPLSTAATTALGGKQDTLVSGTNIKTVGGVSLLGSGDVATGTGTVTTVSVVTANGFAGTVATDTTTPAITLTTSLTGLLKGNGTAMSAASAGTDYVAPGGALGTPSSGTLTNGTGLPIATGVSGLGTGVATFLATPSSANLAAAVTDETGTGVLVLATSPTLVTPVIGVATATSINKVAITAPATSATLTVIDGTTLTGPAATDTLVGRTSTDTLTNKRVTVRVGSTTSSATPTINTDNVDVYKLTAQTADITSFTTNLSGTPTDNQFLIIEITGTAARAITWGASFEASTVALPTTTVSTDMLAVAFLWNTVTSKWRCVAAV